ncbi:YkvI family membrane protein [Aestuariirhabdus litorea]|uniref:Membrane protein YkvI n=1 Tax=Aestuariirhabdus litorea TaxID=2528527 RepID=A0A3P3VNJ9_9GAMM|nr:hypothetical protein [Aestuariirhabdus litorea]RRJ82403.1 hypothetical protein D0544_11015 [Aestuariirhabdus litorea]RWW92566.1 hypothetical protein DZC74_10995 [Endozoicomonadaceae bacterium GTF-13]
MFQDAFKTLKIAGAIVALIVGAGFATGQEVMQFFVVHGSLGLAGTLIFFALCSYATISLLLVGQKYHFKSGEEVFRYYLGDIAGKLMSWFATLFLFSAYVVMLSGAGSVISQSFGVPVAAGAGLMAVLVLLVVIFGLQQLVNVVGSIGPLLVGLVVVIALSVLMDTGLGFDYDRPLAESGAQYQATPYWWLSGIIYLAFQVIGLASILPVIGGREKISKNLIGGGLLGSLLLFLTLLLLVLALIASTPAVTGAEIPTLVLAAQSTGKIAELFVYIILAGIFTTCAPCLWMVLARFSPDDKSKKYRLYAAVLSLLGYFCSVLLPFSALVNFIFPLAGYLGVIFLFFVARKQVFGKARVEA